MTEDENARERAPHRPTNETSPTFWVLLALIVVFGAWLRFDGLGEPSMWLDEILHLGIARTLTEQPWQGFLTGMTEVDGATENGALYYALFFLGDRLLPGETGARLAPALVGTLTIGLMALVALRLGRLDQARPLDPIGAKALAATSAFLLAISPLHVYFSREARPYYLLMAIALILLLALLDPRSRLGRVSAYVGCLAAAYSGAHAIPVLASFGALAGFLSLLRALPRASKPRVETLLGSPHRHCVIAASLALVMSFGLYLSRSEINTPQRAETETQVELRNKILFEKPLSNRSRDRFVASMTTAGKPSRPRDRSWVLLGVAALGALALVRRSWRTSILCTGMFVLPAALSVAALLSVGRWYGVRYTTAALPALLVLTGVGFVVLGQLAGRLAARVTSRDHAATVISWLVSVVLLLVIAAPNLRAAREDPHEKLDWRGIARFFDEIALDDEPVLIANDWPQVSLGHYLDEMNRPTEFVKLWESAERGKRAVAERERGWLLTAGYKRSNEVRSWMNRFVPVLKRRQESMALFFFPDFTTLFETRFAAGKQGPLERIFQDYGQRFEFGGGEATLQGAGWSFPEESPDRDFQWVIGAEAELGLPVEVRADAVIRFSALPFLYPDAPTQSVAVWLNEQHLDTIELEQAWSTHEIRVDASSWSQGPNILYLRFAHSQRPARVIDGSNDRRELAAAFDYLEIVTPTSL